MGLVYAEIELINAGDLELQRRGYIVESEVKRAKVTALVDSGAYMLCINEHLRQQLDLALQDRQEVELADGSLAQYDIVGPIKVCFENRLTSCNALVFPGEAEILLGAISMEDMDVLIEPRTQKLVVNPANPYMAKKKVKGTSKNSLFLRSYFGARK